MYFPGTDMLNKNDLGNLTNLGLVTNNAALSADGISTRISLLKRGYNIRRLFSPEHGLDVQQADGVAVADNRDAATGLPVVSLYGQLMKPDARLLADLDAVLFDIPDVGCRFYTYLWTMTFVMEACAEAGIPFYVLDRPNPIGGDLAKAEGPMLDEINCSSFLGRWNIPLRHSCTLGELATYFAATRLPALKLKVIKYAGWHCRQSMLNYPECFTPTSPAIQCVETAIIYPGSGFWEGVNLHEGRGTPFAFRQFGAPWIDSMLLLEKLQEEMLPGVSFEPVRYLPHTSRYAGQHCKGLLLRITNEDAFNPVYTGIRLLQLIQQLFPNHFTTAAYPTHANPAGEKHLDKLTGVKNSFEQLQSYNWIEAIGIQEQWRLMIKPYLLYPRE